MGQIRKINDLYYIEFHARGLLYSQAAGRTPEEAQKLLREVEDKIAGGEALTLARTIELPDFFERFMVELKLQQDGSKTIRRFDQTIKDFSAFLNKEMPLIHRLDQLTPAVLESYKVRLTAAQKPKVVNLTILLIRDVLEFGIKLGFINDNPGLHVRLMPWPKSPPRRSTPRYDQAGRLLSQGVSLSKVSRLLKFPDIARTVYFSNLIPLSRYDLRD